MEWVSGYGMPGEHVARDASFKKKQYDPFPYIGIKPLPWCAAQFVSVDRPFSPGDRYSLTY